MKGRSEEQVRGYEAELEVLAAVLAHAPMNVAEIRDTLVRISAGRNGQSRRPTAATVYARMRALVESGVAVVARKRRRRIPGKSGTRERVYSVVLPERR